MVCKECGKEIAEGRMYCDACLGDMEAQEQEVITISRADVMRAEKKMRTQLDLTGYVSALPKKNMRLFMLFGAIFTYISPFLAWISRSYAEVNEGKEKHFASLFDLAGKKHEMAMNSGALTMVALILMLSGVLMLLCSAKGYIPISDMFNSRIMMYLPVVLSVFAIVKFFLTKCIRSSWKLSSKPAYGMILCFVGLVMYSISIFAEEKAE